MKNKTLEVLIGALDEFISDNQIGKESAVGSAIYAVDAEARAELERRNQPVTIDRLMRDGEEGRWRWYARLDGGVETNVRDLITLVVRFTPDFGFTDRAYAVVYSETSNTRVNIDCMHDLDELIRLFSIPPQRKTTDVLC